MFRYDFHARKKKIRPSEFSYQSCWVNTEPLEQYRTATILPDGNCSLIPSPLIPSISVVMATHLHLVNVISGHRCAEFFFGGTRSYPGMHAGYKLQRSYCTNRVLRLVIITRPICNFYLIESMLLWRNQLFSQRRENNVLYYFE